MFDIFLLLSLNFMLVKGTNINYFCCSDHLVINFTKEMHPMNHTLTNNESEAKNKIYFYDKESQYTYQVLECQLWKGFRELVALSNSYIDKALSIIDDKKLLDAFDNSDPSKNICGCEVNKDILNKVHIEDSIIKESKMADMIYNEDSKKLLSEHYIEVFYTKEYQLARNMNQVRNNAVNLVDWIPSIKCGCISKSSLMKDKKYIKCGIFDMAIAKCLNQFVEDIYKYASKPKSACYYCNNLERKEKVMKSSQIFNQYIVNNISDPNILNEFFSFRNKYFIPIIKMYLGNPQDYKVTKDGLLIYSMNSALSN